MDKTKIISIQLSNLIITGYKQLLNPNENGYVPFFQDTFNGPTKIWLIRFIDYNYLNNLLITIDTYRVFTSKENVVKTLMNAKDLVLRQAELIIKATAIGGTNLQCGFKEQQLYVDYHCRFVDEFFYFRFVLFFIVVLLFT